MMVSFYGNESHDLMCIAKVERRGEEEGRGNACMAFFVVTK